MNSRYTFKAKRKDNQEWVYGSLIIEKSSSMCLQEYGIPFIETYYIYTIEDGNNHYSKIEIKKETLCQCTGLQDREGNYIFENDIVEYKTPKYNDKTKRINYKKVKRIVVYDISMGMYCLAKSSEEKDIICSDIFDLKNKIWYCKIIGNKFDEVEE